jgi:hypothetical protein
MGEIIQRTQMTKTPAFHSIGAFKSGELSPAQDVDAPSDLPSVLVASD